MYLCTDNKARRFRLIAMHKELYYSDCPMSGHGLMETMNSFLVATAYAETFPFVSNENAL